jgi:putative heme-binding domain-containing protein
MARSLRSRCRFDEPDASQSENVPHRQPNRNVDQAFRATTFNLQDGRTVTGLLLREQGAVLVLADSQGKEVRVDKALVEEQHVSQLSPMPANLVDQIPEADFYNLLAYLLTQQPAKAQAPLRPGS